MPLFKLIRSVLFDEHIDETDLAGIDWRAVFNEARKQTVTGIVAEAVGRLPKSLQPDAEMMRKLMTHSIRNLQMHATLDATIARMTDFYRKHGIEGVVLKGQGVARYYDNPQMRQCGDIDFYITAGEFERAVTLAVDEWEGGRRNYEQEVYKHYDLHVGQASVELHRRPTIPKRPWQRRRFDRWIDSLLEDRNQWRPVEIGGEQVNLPPVLFDSVYIFYHAFSHLIEDEGVGLRQLCDWAMVLKRAHSLGLTDEVGRVVSDLGLQRPWRIMGYILVNFLGLPEAAMPLYSDKYQAQSMRLLKHVMRGGNFGSFADDVTTTSHKGMWAGKFTTFRRFNKNLRRMWYLSPADVMGSYMWYTTTGAARAVRRALR